MPPTKASTTAAARIEHRVDAEAVGQAGADTAEPAGVGVALVAAGPQPGEAVVEEGRLRRWRGRALWVGFSVMAPASSPGEGASP